ncbi:fatty acid desaturase [Legionella sp. W05-934-2]|uniref:fatty acid desaturase n=1 Tax=Legionella sp. W05-934-2 TaxID=1198649 RepID=UPI0034626476
MHDLMKEWQSEHKHELQPPVIAWPTLLLFFLALSIFIGSLYWCVTGHLSLWAGFFINAICQFIMFTVLHDASHRSLSQIPWINESIGTLATIILTPIAGIKVFRFIHMQHHRFTNAGVDQDPDQWSAVGPKWLLVFRWMFFDIHYVHWYLSRWHERPKRERLELLIILPGAIILMVTLALLGYGWQILWLWLLSGRLAATLLVATFDYLPHVPHDTTAQENEYRATNIRPNQSWLMTPLLLGQNYHLIHHLYPRLPFYQYIWVWHHAEKQLRASGARILNWRGQDISDKTNQTSSGDTTAKEAS